MGESWGDLTAAEYMFEHGYSNGSNIWAVGPYATGNKTVGIRDYAIDANPLNYSDYGFDTPGVEVHADGEIWNGTMWEVRKALVAKYDAAYPTHRQGAEPALRPGHRHHAPRPRPPSARATGAGCSWSSTPSCSSRAPRACSTPATPCWPPTGCASAGPTRPRCGTPSPAAAWAATPPRRTPTPATRSPASPRRGRRRPRSPSPRSPPPAPRCRRKIFVGDYEARATPVADTIAGTRAVQRRQADRRHLPPHGRGAGLRHHPLDAHRHRRPERDQGADAG